MPQATQQAALPPEAEMDRDDALDAFVAVANCCEPDHPYGDIGGSVYPLSADDVDYGVTRTYYARCGPRPAMTATKVSYKTRLSYISGLSTERHLALLTHEISHIPDTADYESGSHPPSFWREMAFNALLVRDSIRDGGGIPETFGDIDGSAFLREVVNDPNPSTVDQRYMTVEECRDMLADLVGFDR